MSLFGGAPLYVADPRQEVAQFVNKFRENYDQNRRLPWLEMSYQSVSIFVTDLQFDIYRLLKNLSVELTIYLSIFIILPIDVQTILLKIICYPLNFRILYNKTTV